MDKSNNYNFIAKILLSLNFFNLITFIQNLIEPTP